MSLPSFVHDVVWAFAEFVNKESYKFAATGKAEYPMVAPEGGKEPLRAEYSAYTMGSDHDVYQDSSFGIPAIYLNDWPDRYIHTNFDTAANIDPTKLKRAAFIGAASGFYLASKHAKGELEEIILSLRVATGIRQNDQSYREMQFSSDEARRASLEDMHRSGEWQRSLRLFVGDGCLLSEGPDCLHIKPVFSSDAKGDGRLRFQRNALLKGPLTVFGYDYFSDHAKAAGVAAPQLLSYEGLWGSGEEYAYEVLNFADGKRNAQEIRDAVLAEYGPVPLEMVVEYLRALEKIGVVENVK